VIYKLLSHQREDVMQDHPQIDSCRMATLKMTKSKHET
jgi:hypothetical protein